jgi:hypothetical protein
MKNRIENIFGKQFSDRLLEISFENDGNRTELENGKLLLGALSLETNLNCRRISVKCEDR